MQTWWHLLLVSSFLNHQGRELFAKKNLQTKLRMLDVWISGLFQVPAGEIKIIQHAYKLSPEKGQGLHQSYWPTLSMFGNLWYAMYVNLAKLSLSVHVTNHPIFFVHPWAYAELCVTLRTLYSAYTGWLHCIQVPQISIASTRNSFLIFAFFFNSASQLFCHVSLPVQPSTTCCPSSKPHH